MVSERSVCKITQDIAFVFRAVLCSRGGPSMWALLKKSLLFKVYQKTMYIPTVNLHFASFVLHKMVQRSNFAHFLSQRYRV